MENVFIFALSKETIVLYLTYQERLRERPKDVLATYTSA
jgi:hypothetical protein